VSTSKYNYIQSRNRLVLKKLQQTLMSCINSVSLAQRDKVRQHRSVGTTIQAASVIQLEQQIQTVQFKVQ